MLNSFTATLKPAALQHLEYNTMSWVELLFLKSSDSQQGKEATCTDCGRTCFHISHLFMHVDKTLRVVQYYSHLVSHNICVWEVNIIIVIIINAYMFN